MKLSFHGACREVTGSCAYLSGNNFQLLVDCGFFQGDDYIQDRNREMFPFKAEEIDFVLLTHAHLDHCGRLPKLYKEGFRGQIFCTPPTKDLAEIILLDALKISTENSQKEDVPAIFSETDVSGVMSLIKTIEYRQQQQINSQLSFIAYDAGHILGAASFKVFVQENNQEKTIIFSGDLGNPPAPLMNDPELIKGADFVVIESTYGGKRHKKREVGVKKLKQAIKEAASNRGVLLIPVFALEKVQEVIFEINQLVETRQVPLLSYYLDSPMASKTLSVYQKYLDYFDEQTKTMIKSGDDVFRFDGFNIIEDAGESYSLNDLHPPKVILAGSGMLNGGRMPRHLRNEIYNPNAHLFFVSYQARGTLGRRLQDGEKNVRIDRQEFEVKLKVSANDSFSAHADEKNLEKWLKALQSPKPKKIFVVHGEDLANEYLATYIKKKIKTEAIIPEQGIVFEL